MLGITRDAANGLRVVFCLSITSLVLISQDYYSDYTIHPPSIAFGMGLLASFFLLNLVRLNVFARRHLAIRIVLLYPATHLVFVGSILLFGFVSISGLPDLFGHDTGDRLSNTVTSVKNLGAAYGNWFTICYLVFETIRLASPSDLNIARGHEGDA